VPRHRVLQPDKVGGPVDRGPRRRFAREISGPQRGSRGASHRGVLGSGDFGGGTRNDVTIADFVADLRAPTPLAAAELAVPLRDDLLARVAAARGAACARCAIAWPCWSAACVQQGIERAASALDRRVGRAQQRVDDLAYVMRERMRAVCDAASAERRALEARLRRFDVRPRLASGRRRLETAAAAAEQSVRMRLAAARRFRAACRQARQLSPLGILSRGICDCFEPGRES